jgi:methyltransferase (TIGR00027 family)
VDQPGAQEWKKRRLIETGFGIPPCLHFVPVDFEAGASWWTQLTSSGFDTNQPAVVVSTGVSMYLTRDAIMATLRQVSGLAPGSTFAMTYIIPIENADPEERPARMMAEKGARASGTPFMSFFTSQEIVQLAREAGFQTATHISAKDLSRRYFTGRKDGLRLSKSEELLIGTT